jgi:cell division protein FtsQ
MPRNVMIDMQERSDARSVKRERARLKVVRGASVVDTDVPAGVPRRWLLQGMLFIAMLSVVGIATTWLAQRYARSFAVQTISIDGEFHNQQAHEIQQALGPYVNGDFFTVDLDRARQALINLAWIREVSLRRGWPNRIVVKIEEQIPVALWNETAYLNDAAVVFSHSYIDGEIEVPHLQGPAGTQAQVLLRFQQWQPAFSTAGLRLKKVILDGRYSWTAITADGIAIRLGKEKIEERLQRFLSMVPHHLQAKMTQIHSIDLRYSNGFSISWSKPLADSNPVKERDRDV